MKLLVWLLAIFIVAVAVSLGAGLLDGYVLIVQPPYRIELSLVLFVLIIVGLCLFSYGVIRLVRHTLALPTMVREFRERRIAEKARAAMADAVRALFEGRYGKAQKSAAVAYELGNAPTLNALIAARAAHRMRQFIRRDEWLARARDPQSDTRASEAARLMTEAELLLDQHRSDEALAALARMHEGGPKHIAAMLLAMKANQRAGRWEDMLRVIRQLEKANALQPAIYAARLKRQAQQGVFESRNFDTDALVRYWRSVPTIEKADAVVAGLAAKAFIRAGRHQVAEEIIADALDREWNSDLVLLYAEHAEARTLEQINRAEKWLVKHPQDANLLYALGKLCTRLELWGKAQNYLEASLSVTESRETHLALARLHDQLGRTDEANAHYRKSTAL